MVSDATNDLEDLRMRILNALRGLRFGAVEVQVHDFRVVRITRTERIRLDKELPVDPRQSD